MLSVAVINDFNLNDIFFFHLYPGTRQKVALSNILNVHICAHFVSLNGNIIISDKLVPPLNSH